MFDAVDGGALSGPGDDSARADGRERPFAAGMADYLSWLSKPFLHDIRAMVSRWPPLGERAGIPDGRPGLSPADSS